MNNCDWINLSSFGTSELYTRETDDIKSKPEWYAKAIIEYKKIADENRHMVFQISRRMDFVTKLWIEMKGVTPNLHSHQIFESIDIHVSGPYDEGGYVLWKHYDTHILNFISNYFISSTKKDNYNKLAKNGYLPLLLRENIPSLSFKAQITFKIKEGIHIEDLKVFGEGLTVNGAMRKHYGMFSNRDKTKLTTIRAFPVENYKTYIIKPTDEFILSLKESVEYIMYGIQEGEGYNKMEIDTTIKYKFNDRREEEEVIISHTNKFNNTVTLREKLR